MTHPATRPAREPELADGDTLHRIPAQVEEPPWEADGGGAQGRTARPRTETTRGEVPSARSTAAAEPEPREARAELPGAAAPPPPAVQAGSLVDPRESAAEGPAPRPAGRGRGGPSAIRSALGSLAWRLVAPSPHLADQADRSSAAALSALLLLSLPVGGLTIASRGAEFFAARGGFEGVSFGIAFLVIAAAYLVSRTRHFRWAPIVAAAAVGSHTLTTAAAWVEPLQAQASLLFSLVGPLCVAVACRPAVTAAVAAADLALLGAVAWTHPSLPRSSAVDVLVLGGGVCAMIVALSRLQWALTCNLSATARALDASRDRFALAALGASDGLWDWDMETGRVWLSPRWTALLGMPEGERESGLDEWFDRVDPGDLPRLRATLGEHVAGLSPFFENLHRLRHSDGTWRWVQARGLAVRDEAGRVRRVAGSITDVTERRQFEEQLLHDAFHDELTGLPNRALFLNRLAHSLARGRRRRTYLFAVLFLDLDRFKLVNDGLGHRTGDTLLVHIARRLEGCVRPGDTVARLGGDEFTILLDDLDDPADADLVAHRVQDALSHPFHLDRHEIVTSASIGIALSTHEYVHPEDLIRDADTAMYRAKADGKARHRVFDAVMHEDAIARLRLEADLRRAVVRGEFTVHYQPIVDLRSGRLDGFEALVRWEHPDRGLVHPVEFIPVAEETGTINSIGWTVLREACRQTAEWRRGHAASRNLRISVNLSGRQLHQPELVRGIASILKDTDLPSDALRLEITETALMESGGESARVLRALREHGVRVTIDDFGTGYSSLNYLHDFEIDGLKIDRSFVARIEGERRPELIQTVLDLGRNLRVSVVAEGIETDLQLATLKDLGCEYGQGYLFARPLDATAADRLLSRDPRW